MDSFEFNCPNTYVDLSQGGQFDRPSDGWFFSEHPEHEEPADSPATDAKSPFVGKSTTKKSISLMSASGSVQRVQSKKLNPDVNEVHNSEVKRGPVTSMSVSMVSFAKSTSVSAPKNTDSQLKVKKGVSVEHQLKRKGISDTSEAQPAIIDMKSKLNEYQRSKKAIVQENVRKIAKTSSSNDAISASNSSVGQSANRRGRPQNKDTMENQDMLDILKRHNEKFAVAPLYEPPRHSVRDVRQWERETGKIWSQLKPEEREVANEEITRNKESSNRRQ
jgi:hypothetical protein